MPNLSRHSIALSMRDDTEACKHRNILCGRSNRLHYGFCTSVRLSVWPVRASDSKAKTSTKSKIGVQVLQGKQE